MKDFRFFFPVEFGKAFIPEFLRPKVRKWLLKAGETEVPTKFFGFLFYTSLIIATFIFIFAIVPMFHAKSVLFVLLISFFSWAGLEIITYSGLFLIYYLYIEQQIYVRTQKMEDVLEDFLHLVSENLKGGMTLEEAFWDAVRPEFGVLAFEIRLAAKKVMTGEDVSEALKQFMEMYNSPLLTRSFNLIIQAIEGGSRLSEVMDRIIANITETKMLKREMAATNMTYVIFITFVVLVITPGLFTLSAQFLQILGSFSQNVGASGTEGVVNLPIDFSKIKADPAVFATFSYAAVLISAGCAAMIVSIIRKGSIRAGIKLIPVYMGISLVLFIILSKMAETIVKNIFGF